MRTRTCLPMTAAMALGCALAGCTTLSPAGVDRAPAPEPLPPTEVLAAAAAADGWRVEGLRVAASARPGGGVRVEGVGMRLTPPDTFRGAEPLVVIDSRMEGPASAVAQARLDGVAIGRIEVLPAAEAEARYGPAGSAGGVVILTLTLEVMHPLPPGELPAIGAHAQAPPTSRAVVLVDGAQPGDSIRPERMRAVEILDATAADAAFGPRAGGGVANHISRSGPSIELPVREKLGGWTPPGPTGKPFIILDDVAVSDPTGNTDLTKLDIDSVSIIHAPYAYWLFGQRGAGGVVVVRTDSAGGR